MSSAGIRIHLCHAELWKSFHEHTTEMIVTKTGRKLFPKLEIQVAGMNPHTEYGIQMRLERADDQKYRYSLSRWTPSRDDDNFCFPETPPIDTNEGFVHCGEFWMQKGPIAFDNFKITNNQDEKARNMILVQTLHKYVPVVYVFDMTASRAGYCDPILVAKERFSLAEFITVTAYQNEAIKNLKTTHNPFAKGSRGSQAQSIRERSGTTCQKRALSPSRQFMRGECYRTEDGSSPSKMASPAFPNAQMMPLTPPIPFPFDMNLTHVAATVPHQIPSPAFPQQSATVSAAAAASPTFPFPSPPQEKTTPTVTPPHHIPQHPFDFSAFAMAAPMMEYGMMMMQPQPYSNPFFPAPPMDYSMFTNPYMFPAFPQPQELHQPTQSDAADSDLITVQPLE
ncbi:hypothetical protein PFISCL1PPCAC_9253 [Pristionchus fissidentatus]|uniref:T-box domain-containing protein n=1 Tax=Pristionchus fissidentatus TaxID=1538716 RepID=A0AAV5VE43_9BILA|nr:hypothetical protein PFISCL1PPCAC_9253 [Pristionchus fissidentatus]